MNNPDTESINEDDEEYLDTNEAAPIIKTKPQTMAAWRSRGQGPKYVKFGKLVRYTRSHLRQYARDNTVSPSKGGAR
jgi:Helix-turn-helix domain